MELDDCSPVDERDAVDERDVVRVRFRDVARSFRHLWLLTHGVAAAGVLVVVVGSYNSLGCHEENTDHEVASVRQPTCVNPAGVTTLADVLIRFVVAVVLVGTSKSLLALCDDHGVMRPYFFVAVLELKR